MAAFGLVLFRLICSSIFVNLHFMMEHWQQQRTQCLVFEPTISNILNFAGQTVQGMFRYDTDQKYQDFTDYLGKRFR